MKTHGASSHCVQYWFSSCAVANENSREANETRLFSMKDVCGNITCRPDPTDPPTPGSLIIWLHTYTPHTAKTHTSLSSCWFMCAIFGGTGGDGGVCVPGTRALINTYQINCIKHTLRCASQYYFQGQIQCALHEYCTKRKIYII